MFKKSILLALAILQMAAANLTVRYAVIVDGRELPGTFSAGEIERGYDVSRAVAGEILPGSDFISSGVSCKKFVTFSAEPGDKRMLTDALICSVSGVSRCCEVSTDDEVIGVVEDPDVLTGSDLKLRPVYSRTHRDDAQIVLSQLKIPT